MLFWGMVQGDSNDVVFPVLFCLGVLQHSVRAHLAAAGDGAIQRHHSVCIDRSIHIHGWHGDWLQDFYAVVKERLQPGGILAQWLPGGDDAVKASVARALKNSFPK
jgi:hypothetical protein